MRLHSWNIKQGGRSRSVAILERLIADAPDVIVLGEYMPGASDELITGLKQRGWSHCVAPTPPARCGGVAVLSRHRLEHRELPPALDDLGFRYQAVGVPDCDLELRAIYAPLHKDPYARFWTAVLDALERESSKPVLVVGDLNTGIGPDAEADRVFCQHFFKQLPQRGYSDLWRAIHGDAAEFTWHGQVNRYRLDHAFGSLTVLNRLESCFYDHAVRDEGLSDHSLMTVELAAAD